MEKWITRLMATLCAAGSAGLLWTLGVFILTPWRKHQLLALSGAELQLIAVPLIAGLAVAWGALHLYALADRTSQPKLYAGIRIALIALLIIAFYSGVTWTQVKLA